MIYRRFVLFATFATVCLASLAAGAAELPILHLRRADAPPPLVTTLQNPDEAASWYPSSPTWFGGGGLEGDRNHTEVMATYDDDNLYIAVLNIDRSRVLYPLYTTRDVSLADSSALWIQTGEGRSFYLISALHTGYPPGAQRASGEFPAYQTTADRLGYWEHAGWHSDGTNQHIYRIPWSTLRTAAPAPGARWRINFINYNQTSPGLSAATRVRQAWAPGARTTPAQWGWLTFDVVDVPPASNISPEATLTLRPATGWGDELTLRAGNGADHTNEWGQEAITESDWNDWDPIDYTIKEFLQFDFSMIPRDRVIVSATLENWCRGPFNLPPSDAWLHVIRLDGTYNPSTVTMLTSPPPVENGARRLVRVSDMENWVPFDVTNAVRRAFEKGQHKAAFALAGTSGDIHNGKIWETSFGRADWYDHRRPRLRITFGKPGVTFPAPVSVGSLNATSVATVSSKNKLTNGTFRYGSLEGISNTTYWQDAGSIRFDDQNVPVMQMAGDINDETGSPAVRFSALGSWRSFEQMATGLVGERTYTFSGWYKSSVRGLRADVRVVFMDKDNNPLDGHQEAYSGSGEWEQVVLTRTAPEGTVKARVMIFCWTDGRDAFMLYSDLQLEEGGQPTAYSETMAVYYPNHPRRDGAAVGAPTRPSTNRNLRRSGGRPATRP